MPSPTPEVLALAQRYRLALRDLPTRGAAGERLGKGTGSSLEFQDRRTYVPGDDVRHLDWKAYARTDQVMVRLYREEILPRVELVVDGSRSMAVEPEKSQLAVDLATLLFACGRADGFDVRLVHMRDRTELVAFDELLDRGLEFDGQAPLAEGVDAAFTLLRPGAIRILVSDFLSPHEPHSVVRRFAARGGGLALVQVLGRFDQAPEVGEALRLTDAETNEVLDLVLDARTVERYVERVRRLEAGLAQEARRASGVFVTLDGAVPLADACRAKLAASGVLTPA
ncbi:MAG: DUF58 domain-containing protein [bacterium]|nr:DUF58 domain-containing protein [bacterium]